MFVFISLNRSELCHMSKQYRGNKRANNSRENSLWQFSLWVYTCSSKTSGLRAIFTVFLFFFLGDCFHDAAAAEELSEEAVCLTTETGPSPDQSSQPTTTNGHPPKRRRSDTAGKCCNETHTACNYQTTSGVNSLLLVH